MDKSEDLMEFVDDRPGHDFRYSMNSKKLQNELGWKSKTNFELGINGNSVEFDIPTELNFETTNEVRANIGLRFNIAVLALQANHTFSKYPVTTVGVGLSLR